MRRQNVEEWCVAVVFLLLAAVAAAGCNSDIEPTFSETQNGSGEPVASERPKLETDTGKDPQPKPQPLEDQSEPQKKQEEPEEPKHYLVLDMQPTGEILINGKPVKPDEFLRAMKKEHIKGAEEEIGGIKVSAQEVLIKTDESDRYGRIAGILAVLARTGFYKMYYSHPEVAKSKPVKAWLPVETGVSTGFLTLQGVRVKLHWVDKANTGKKLYADQDPRGNKGMTFMKGRGYRKVEGQEKPKLDTHDLMKKGSPDWSEMAAMLKLGLEMFRPTNKVKELPIVIDPMAKVPFEDVLRCITLCIESGAKNISLAPPEDHFQEK